MKFVAAKGMRDAESLAISKNIALAMVMMDQAGKELARTVGQLASFLGASPGVLRFLAGPGNNGGDAFAAALYLRDMGLNSEVWLACPKEKLRAPARTYFDQMVLEKIPYREMLGEKAWRSVAEEALPPAVLVDALLGTGAEGDPRGDILRAVEYLRERSAGSLIVSADIPTGMDADTGAVSAHTVRADVTVTMGFPKAGMANPAAMESLGSLVAADIRLPAEYADAIPDACPGLQWISGADVRNLLPRRARASHKGLHGRALLLGGSAAYPGAIVLAVEGALRSGAGLVRVATVAPAAAAVLARAPEAIVGATLTADFPLAGADSIMAGPGLGRDPEARRLVARLLHETSAPLVLDADAIALLEGKPEAVRPCAQPVVLTPHPGEMALLLGKTVAEIQRDRPAAAREAAERTGAIIVLKGAGTLVAKAGQTLWINLNGNPGMASGGSGDVLAGLLAGLLAQKMDPFAAACAAAWLHGAAGDIAAWRKTQTAMKAGDIVDALPDAFRQACLR